MKEILYPLLAAGAGACIALQAVANSRLRTKLDDNPLFAMYFSICGTILTATVAMLLLRPTIPTWDTFKQTQWWNWIGGPLGVLFVLAGAALVRELGSAAFIVLVVAGQLVVSLLFDHFAVMGLPEQPVTPGRLLGVLLVVGGAVCIKLL
jgi:bacterial/archaeal transporter family-2 protein